MEYTTKNKRGLLAKLQHDLSLCPPGIPGARFTKTVQARILHNNSQIGVSRILAGIVLQEFTRFFIS